MVNIVWQGSAETRTTYTWQKKVVRTSDGTIHVVITRITGGQGYSTHFHSHDNGQTWDDGVNLWNWDERLNPCIDADSSDNLVAADMPYYNISFKRATVDKSNPSHWVWTWGNAVSVRPYNENYYPDILVDGNGYIHIVWYRIYGQANMWARSINNGANWTQTELTGMKDYLSIVKDSSNNLYIGGDDGGLLTGPKAVKITYSAGPSWNVGSVIDISPWTGWGNRPMGWNILSDGRILFVYQKSSGNDLMCVKTTNPYNITTWDSPVTIRSSFDSGYNATLMVKNSTDIRVYFVNNGILYYRKSVNLGSTWGSDIQVFATVTNIYPNCTRRSGIFYYDYVWTNGYTIYHSLSSPLGEGWFPPHTISINDLIVSAISWRERQECNVAKRITPKRTSGTYVDTGTYVLKNRILEIKIRLTDSEKSSLVSIINQHALVEVNTATGWSYTGWIQNKNFTEVRRRTAQGVSRWLATIELALQSFSYG